MQPRFDLPTLVTLTAPTCAGKNFLLEALIDQLGFERIVSTTDRAARAGEIEGVHYNFISTEQSKKLEAQGDLAELVTYNGVRYGVTHREMEAKMSTGRPPLVILEPKGIEIYQKYCSSKGWQLFKIYVETQESIRLERLVSRTTADILTRLNKNATTFTVGESVGLPLSITPDYDIAHDIQKIISVNNKRMQAIIEQERGWSHTNRWDVLADGTNVTKALEQVRAGVANRNKRTDIYA